jgi:hypothetical protein
LATTIEKRSTLAWPNHFEHFGFDRSENPAEGTKAPCLPHHDPILVNSKNQVVSFCRFADLASAIQQLGKGLGRNP